MIKCFCSLMPSFKSYYKKRFHINVWICFSSMCVDVCRDFLLFLSTLLFSEINTLFFKTTHTYFDLLYWRLAWVFYNWKEMDWLIKFIIKKKNLFRDTTAIFKHKHFFYIFIFLHIVLKKWQELSYGIRNVYSST